MRNAWNNTCFQMRWWFMSIFFRFFHATDVGWWWIYCMVLPKGWGESVLKPSRLWCHMYHHMQIWRAVQLILSLSLVLFTECCHDFYASLERETEARLRFWLNNFCLLECTTVERLTRVLFCHKSISPPYKLEHWKLLRLFIKSKKPQKRFALAQ